MAALLLFGGLFGSNSTNSTVITQDTMTQINQRTSADCSAVCNANQSGNIVIITDSTIKGGAGFAQSCSAKANCTISNTMASQVDNIIAAITQQTNESTNSIIGSIGHNEKTNNINIKQTTRNFITQVVESTCTATAMFNQSNNLFYASNSNIGGFAGFQIGIDPPATANAACTMTNLSKIIVYNKEQADATQKNSSLSVLVFIVIAIVIAAVIAFVVFIVLLIVGKSIFSKKNTPAPVNTASDDDVIAAAAAIEASSMAAVPEAASMPETTVPGEVV